MKGNRRAGVWSSGMILASGARGREFDSRNTPYASFCLAFKLNANRMIIGTLRGFDQFMNLVVDNTVEVNGNEKTDIGMVVIRGNSVVTVEALEPVNRIQGHASHLILLPLWIDMLAQHISRGSAVT
ncbi:putative small nuclear ribonucleoprotein G [Senna tora]|uniref:Small nuclear ribonucleoprotein G n=1 Tax=Senna tora TaxID=362788 RepID=A0A834SIT8_9FABA|nr:putative small nuclear ribonucleoprotein G [Senna tora]